MTVRSKKINRSSELERVVDKESDKDLKDFGEKVDVGKKVIGSSSDQFSFIELLMLTLFVVPLTAHVVTVAVRVGPKFLEPVLGNFFPHFYFYYNCAAFVLLGLVLGVVYNSTFVSKLSVRLGQIGFLMGASQLFLTMVFESSEQLGPFFSSYIAYAAPVYLPIMNATWINTSLFLHHLSFFKLEDTKLHAVALVTIHISSIVLGVGATMNWPQFLTVIQSSCINFSLTGLACALVVLFLNFTLLQVYKPSVVDKVLMPSVIFLVVASTLKVVPHCSSELLEAHREPRFGIRLLDRKETDNGWFIVAQRDEDKLRVFRAGHSIIGGKFMEYGDSMYPSFYFMEMVNMVKGERFSPPKALQIGLGVGISAQYLMKQGVKVDVVEIESVVVDFAEKHFGLDRPQNVYIEDGRQFLERVQPGSYDYVLHDVFSGGTVPKSLFSVEALELCRSALQPNGVLALNFVGGVVHPYNDTFNAVASTLKHVFKHVRLISEVKDVTEPNLMFNLIFFASQAPIKFGKLPRFDDYQSSRYRILSTYRDYLVPISKYLEKDASPITDADNRLDKMQKVTAEVHFYTMRRFFDSQFWVKY